MLGKKSSSIAGSALILETNKDLDHSRALHDKSYPHLHVRCNEQMDRMCIHAQAQEKCMRHVQK